VSRASSSAISGVVRPISRSSSTSCRFTSPCFESSSEDLCSSHITHRHVSHTNCLHSGQFPRQPLLASHILMFPSVVLKDNCARNWRRFLFYRPEPLPSSPNQQCQSAEISDPNQRKITHCSGAFLIHESDS